jgi:hypothetical protein
MARIARPAWWLALRRSDRWLLGLAAATTGALLVTLLFRAGAIATAAKNNADLAAPLVIARFAHDYSRAQVATGRLGWWGPLWLLQLVRPLFISGLVGLYVPIIVTIALPLLVARQAWRLWGPGAALTIVLVALSIGAATWASGPVGGGGGGGGLGAWSARSPTWWTGGLVALWAVWVARIDDRRRLVLAGLAGIPLALLVGIIGSGDPLMSAAGLIPLGAGAVFLFSRRRWLPGLGLIVLAILGLIATRVVANIASGQLLEHAPGTRINLAGPGARAGRRL